MLKDRCRLYLFYYCCGIGGRMSSDLIERPFPDLTEEQLSTIEVAGPPEKETEPLPDREVHFPHGSWCPKSGCLRPKHGGG